MATKRKATKFNDDAKRRQTKAADHRGVRELDSIMADAVRLQQRLRHWLEANDRPDDTEAVMMLDLATKSGQFDDASEVGDLMHHARGIEWAIRAGTDWIASLLPCPALRDFGREMKW